MSEGKRVDEDWKRRAQAEKEIDAAKVSGAPPAAAGAPPGPAPAPPRAEGRAHPLFGSLIESLASQALLFMGAIRDPMTGQTHQDLHQAQTMIEMLGMVEEKTQGNLTKEETAELKQMLDEVRMHFVRMTQPPPPPNPKGPMMGNKR